MWLFIAGIVAHPQDGHAPGLLEGGRDHEDAHQANHDAPVLHEYRVLGDERHLLHVFHRKPGKERIQSGRGGFYSLLNPAKFTNRRTHHIFCDPVPFLNGYRKRRVLSIEDQLEIIRALGSEA